jgi:4'-phosphopantetheinyl transferase
MPNLRNLSCALEENDVHIFSAGLKRSKSDLSKFEDLLSPDEKIRAERYHFDKDRDAYIIRRGILRDLLGRYSGQAPSAVSFVVGPKGKPELGDEKNNPITFNVTFSAGLALFAFSSGLPIGIDLERIRPVIDMDAIVESFFSKRERKTFFSLPEEKRREAFFKGWTRKEAFVKAIGIGIYSGFGNFSVSMKPDEPAALLDLDEGETEWRQWSLIDIKTDPDFRAALATRFRSPRIQFFSWD